jgi:hypothetical protein
MTINSTSNSFYTVTRLDSHIAPSRYGLPSNSTVLGPEYLVNNFIGCNTEFVNFTYTFVNGSIRSDDITPLDNLDLLNAIYLPVLLNHDPLITGGAATTAMGSISIPQ